jgi:Phage integrase SAM-like domain
LELEIWNRQPATSKNGKKYISHTVCFSPGQSGRLFEADQKPPFYLRDYRKRVGKEWLLLEGAATIAAAKFEAVRVQAILEAAAHGLVLPEAEGLKEGDRLESKIAEYLDETEANKSYKSFLAYKNTLENFLRASCKKSYLNDVGRADLLAFKTFLGNQALSTRSIFNHFANVMIFLKWAKQKVEIKKSDWPIQIERDADAYTPAEIKSLLQNSTPDDQLLLNCFCVQDSEMANWLILRTEISITERP